MQGEQHPTRVLLRKTRERVIEQLSEAFSKDRISLDEFEKRVDEAYAQTTSGELVALVSDLGPLESVTELFVRAVFGNIEITVAPTVAVECEGVGFLGSFATVNRVPSEGAEGGPVLRIVGSAVLGNVEIRTMPVSTRQSGGARALLPPS